MRKNSSLLSPSRLSHQQRRTSSCWKRWCFLEPLPPKQRGVPNGEGSHRGRAWPCEGCTDLLVTFQELFPSRFCASPEFTKAARLHRCKVCQDVAPKPRHHPVSSNFNAELNHTIGADSLEIKDSEGKRYTVLNIVDLGTNFQQAIILKAGGGNPTAQVCLTALQDHWFNWAGLPN